MPNTITNRQMVFILLLTVTPFVAVTIAKPMALHAGTMSWLTLILSSVVFAFMALVWSLLNNRFQGKMLFDYSREIVGKAGAYLLALYFTHYFLTAMVQLDLSASEILKANFLPRTPEWATTLATLPVLGYAAYKGVTNVARLVEIYGVILLSIVLSIHTMMLFQGNLMYIEPFFNPAETGNALFAMKDAVYSFLGFEVLAVIPFTAKNGPKANRTAFLTLLFTGVLYILVVETSIMMIGMHEIVHYNFPLIVAIRQVEVPALKILQRLDIVYLTAGFLGLLGGMAVVYMSAVEFVCRMLPKVKRGIIVALIGAVVFAASAVGQNIKDFSRVLINYLSVIGIFTAGIVPLALFVIAKVRKRGNEKSS